MGRKGNVMTHRDWSRLVDEFNLKEVVPGKRWRMPGYRTGIEPSPGTKPLFKNYTSDEFLEAMEIYCKDVRSRESCPFLEGYGNCDFTLHCRPFDPKKIPPGTQNALKISEMEMLEAGGYLRRNSFL